MINPVSALWRSRYAPVLVLAWCLNTAVSLAADFGQEPTAEAETAVSAVEQGDSSSAIQTDTADEEDVNEQAPAGFWRNIVPVPIVITEPAVGKGLGVALGYFHPTRADGSAARTPMAINANSANNALSERTAPPTITGFAAGYTNNGSKLFGVGHSRTFRQDHVRLNLAAGWTDMFADIYFLGVPFEFNIEGLLFYADTRFRFGDSNFFWGVGATALDADSTFLLPLPDRPPVGLLAFDFLDMGVTGRLMYDTRDETMFPSSGQNVDLAVAVHDQSIAGDYDYVLSKFKALTYHSVGSHAVISGRFEAQHVSGDPPFFAVPYVALRGIPALRYQGESVAVGEAEFRYRFATRWTGLAFAGLGWRDIGPLQIDESIYNFGAGVRFKALKDREVWLGLDIARGPEETYWYIQVGQAW